MGEAVSELVAAGLRNPTRVTVRVKSLKDGGVIEEVRIFLHALTHLL
jgi:ATP-dependent RNA helicase DDX55/SPB4